MSRREGGGAESGSAPDEPGALADGLRRLATGDHAALLFQDDGEAAQTAGDFLRLGLERRERCVHLAEEDTAAHILPHLRAAGVDAGQALAAGALVLASDRDGFFGAGALRPEQAATVLAERAEAALRDGYTALRVSADPRWLFEGAPTLELLLEYEQALQRLAREHPIVGLWRYDRRAWSAGALRVLVRMHPVVIHKGQVYRNHLFVAPSAAAGGRDELEDLLAAIAERDRDDATFAASGERLRLALEGGAHALWDWDVRAGGIKLDPRWAEIPSLEPSTWSVSLADWEQAIHPSDLAQAWKVIQEHLDGRAARLEFECRVKHRTGGWRWVRARGKVAARDAEGRATRVAGTLTDVTDLRALADQHLASARFAAVGTLAAGVAHEINNPLAWITTNLGFLQDLLQSWAQGGASLGALPQVADVLEETRQGAARIRDTVDALRSVGRPVDAGDPVPCDVREEIQAAVAVARHDVVHRARLTLEIPDELPPVLSHPGALRKVFLHLLLNAAQAIPEGPVAEHEVKLTATAAGDAVDVAVSDTGAGMSAHVRAHMFDPFFTTKGPGLGMGLGLSFARALVEASGGRIDVSSQPGRGSSVRVKLARAGSPPPSEQTATAVASGRRRVLVVDDEEILVRAYGRLLERDHDVTALTSPAEALRRIQAGERWDAILFDLQMPELDGMELFEQLQLVRPELTGRVAFITGGAFTPRALAFLERNTRPTLSKPIDAEALRALVARLIAG